MSRQVLVLGLLSMLMVGGSCGSSCVNFDGQTVRLHIDESKDRIDALFVYRGLHSTAPDTERAIEQLEQIRGGTRWFAFFSNWPFMFEVDEIAAQERDPESPLLGRALDLLDRSVDVLNGSLWVDAEGRLNAWQLVRLRDLAAQLDAWNAAMHEALRRPGEIADFARAMKLKDAGSVALLSEAVERGDPFLRVEGQTLQFVLPTSDEGWRAVKRSLLGDLRDVFLEYDGAADDDGDAKHDTDVLIDFLAMNEWSIEREPGRIVFVAGSRHADELRIETPTVGLEGTDLVDTLRERGWAIMPEGDDAPAHAAYQAFRSEN